MDRPSLRVVPTPKVEANESCVKVLERALAMAKSGQLNSVAYVGVMIDGSVEKEVSATCDHITLVGAVTLLQHEMINGDTRGSRPLDAPPSA